jgi:16S rRNA (adenine1518-N6/adenine1519-N6)-dimethyltransferase
MRKPLGQHFLIRGAIIHKIIKALELKPNDHLLEIGPGRGAITIPLVKELKKFLLVEKDVYLADLLRDKFKDLKNVEILTQDFLETAWPQLQKVLGNEFKIVSNLPYQAATAILIKLLTEAKPGTLMVLMFQKEVGDRLLAEPHTKAYGSLTIFVELFAQVKLLTLVPPQAFKPPPQVDSAVLKFNLREKPLIPREELADFENLLQAGFAHRRKMLRQNLKTVFTSESAQQIEERLGSIQASLQARAEELSVEQWLRLFQQWKHKI